MPYPSKNNSTYTAPTKNSSTSSNSGQSSNRYLLKEDGGFLLLENGYKIILDALTGWAYQNKN